MHSHDIPAFLVTFIVMGYLVIAIQFSKLLTLTNNKRARKALLYLVAIFCLCSFCGYISHFIPPNYNWIIICGHVLLTIVTWLYILTHQVEIVINIFRDK